MLIVSYDISSDKVRTKFAKYLSKFGRKLQYSVYEIRNSKRVLQNILIEIDSKYKKHFTGADSVIILQVCEQDKKKVIRYGYAKNDEAEVVFFG